MVRKRTEGTCVVPKCKRVLGAIGVRGMCSSCYKAARIAVNSHSTTWKELEELGLAKPIINAKGAFLQSLDEALNAKRKV